MAFRLFLLAAVLVGARAGVLAPAPLTALHTTHLAAPAIAKVATPVLTQQIAHAPVVAAPVAKAVAVDADYDPNPQYSYAYDIQDALTGDNKNHVESRNGDVVQGTYSLVDPDGTRRTVEYTADPVNGFNAVVHREPATVAVKTVAAAPVHKIATPVAYAAAPVAKFAAPIAPFAYSAGPVTKIIH